MITDPIADMLIRIKNSYASGHKNVFVPYSRLKLKIAQILKEEGYIKDFSKSSYKNKPFIKIELRYLKGIPAISEVKRISKPGRRIYIKKNTRLPYFGGIRIVSTPQGLMTLEKARKIGQGGELLCEIK